MLQTLKRFFCKHQYFQHEQKMVRSTRVGDDNHVILVTTIECVHCRKTEYKEITDRIEKDYYVK